MLKEIAKQDVVKSRVVPVEVIASYKRRIAAFEEDVKAILAQERMEKELRKAEMEANKNQNLMLHHSHHLGLFCRFQI